MTSANVYAVSVGTVQINGPIQSPVDPTVFDVAHPIGSEWVNTVTNSTFVLTSIVAFNKRTGANWVQTGGAGAGVTNVLGTANQVTSSVVGGVATLSLPSSLVLPGSITIPANGKLNVATGANASAGTVTLVAGTATVNNTSVTATSLVFPAAQSLGTVTSPQPLSITNKVTGTSFTITSADPTDTSVIAWQILN